MISRKESILMQPLKNGGLGFTTSGLSSITGVRKRNKVIVIVIDTLLRRKDFLRALMQPVSAGGIGFEASNISGILPSGS